MEKTIKTRLLNAFKDEDLLSDLIHVHAMIAGGAITSCLTDSKINDFDIYFRTKEDFEEIDKIIRSDKNYECIATTDTAITYKHKVPYKNMIVQLIKHDSFFIQDPEALIKKFDFTICMAVYDLFESQVFVHDDFLQHITERKLVFNIDTKYPIISLYRANKYIKRGYNIDGYELVKIALCINNLKMKDYRDLKRQLQGIDTIQFSKITDKLMERPDYEYDYKTVISEIDALKK
jgi:hypothetical protein